MRERKEEKKIAIQNDIANKIEELPTTMWYTYTESCVVQFVSKPHGQKWLKIEPYETTRRTTHREKLTLER